jgi:dTDP-4-amino-4,6-dideoxygalactose transaminase
MMVTQDAGLAERLRKLRTHGGAKQYHHDEVGTNSRLDTIQAAILRVKLPHLDRWNSARRAHAAAYDAAFAAVEGVRAPVTDSANEHIYHQYTIRTPRRDHVVERLKARGIGCAVYYPRPLHLQPCFAPLGYRQGQFPEAERASREVVSLPIYPELTPSQRDEVVAAVGEALA